jgi:hypothetical protein
MKSFPGRHCKLATFLLIATVNKRSKGPPPRHSEHQIIEFSKRRITRYKALNAVEFYLSSPRPEEERFSREASRRDMCLAVEKMS